MTYYEPSTPRSPCIECMSYNTRLFDGDDGHFRKECQNCGYIGGPYVSTVDPFEPGQPDPDRSGQTSLGAF